MKRCMVFLVAILAIGAHADSWLIPFSFETEKAQTHGMMRITAILLSPDGRSISGADMGSGTMFPIPAQSQYRLKVSFCVTDILDEKSFKKDGLINAKMKVGFNNDLPEELDYTEGEGWVLEVALRGQRPGFLIPNALIKYKAGREYARIKFLHIPITFAKQANQVVAASTIFPAIYGAPREPEKLVDWQKQVRAYAADGIIPFDFQYVELQSQATAPVATTTETAETTTEESYVLSVTDETVKVSANAPIKVVVNFGEKLEFKVNGEKKVLDRLERDMQPGKYFLFSKTKDLVFTVITCNGETRTYNATGEEVK